MKSLVPNFGSSSWTPQNHPSLGVSFTAVSHAFLTPDGDADGSCLPARQGQLFHSSVPLQHRVRRGDGEVTGGGTKAIKSQPSVKPWMITQRGGFHFVRTGTGLPRSPTRSPCGRSQTRKYETVQIILRFVHSAGSAHMRDEPAASPHQTC